MGMFDKWSNWTDTFKEGEVFNVSAAKVGSLTTAEYGERDVALLLVDGKWYSLFGATIVGQINRAEDGDFPARVYVGRTPSRKGQPMKVLVPEGMQPEDVVNTGNPDATSDDDIPF